MKTILIILLTAFAFSCNQHIITDRLNEDLFTYYKENLKNEDSTLHLDSVRVLKTDTITKKILGLRKVLSLYNDILLNQKKFELVVQEREIYYKMGNTWRDLDRKLYDLYMDQMIEKKQEELDLIEIDSSLKKTADSLKIIHQTSDSITPVFYQVTCLIQYQRKDLSVKRDTSFAYLSPGKNIVRRADIVYN